MLEFLKALPWKLVSIVLSVLLVFALGCYTGWSVEERVYTNYKNAQAQKAAQVSQASTKSATEVVTKYVDRVKVVEGKTRVITKQVPVYVNSQDDSLCTVNAGFVRMWNASNSGVPLDGTRERTDGAPSGIALHEVAEQHSAESGYTRGLEEQVNSLQDYIEGQVAAQK